MSLSPELVFGKEQNKKGDKINVAVRSPEDSRNQKSQDKERGVDGYQYVVNW